MLPPVILDLLKLRGDIQVRELRDLPVGTMMALDARGKIILKGEERFIRTLLVQNLKEFMEGLEKTSEEES